MIRRTKSLLRAAVAGALASIAVSAAPAGAQQPVSARDQAVFRRLQAAVRAGDVETVGQVAAWELRVNWPNRVETVRGRANFRRRYAAVFDARIRQAILRQAPDSLFQNWRGLMVGNGEVWLTQACIDRECDRHRVRLAVVNHGTPFVTRPVPPVPVGHVPEGRWWPQRAECPHICGEVDRADSVRWWREGLRIAPGTIARGARACRTARFRATRVSGTDFEQGNRYMPHELGLGDSAVVIIQTGCASADRSLPGELIYEDADHLWVRGTGGIMIRLRRAR